MVSVRSERTAGAYPTLEASLRELAEPHGMLSAVLDATNNGIMVTGTDGSVLFANRRWCEFFGIDSHTVVGTRKRPIVEQIVARQDVSNEVEDGHILLQELSPDESRTDEVEITVPAHRILQRYTAPVCRNDGVRIGQIEVFTDMTEVRQLQRNKDEFLSLVSHELRTPITSIKGYAQLLQRRARREALPAATSLAYATIERQSERMQKLIDLLLDLSRLETGRMRLDVEPVDLGALVARVREMVQVTTEEHTIEIRIPPESVVVSGDEHRLEQVLINLLLNAIRYSPEGGTIMIAVSQMDEHADITVRDEGIGIPADAHTRIFERFFRMGEGDVPGLGIGLYISKGIVERHRGSIEVTSEPGKGSTFTVSLPLRLPDRGASNVDNGPR